jgi:hypothetical protein
MKHAKRRLNDPAAHGWSCHSRTPRTPASAAAIPPTYLGDSTPAVAFRHSCTTLCATFVGFYRKYTGARESEWLDHSGLRRPGCP